MHRVRTFAIIGVVGALWSLLFAAISTTDYASHLDRGLHDLHCSFIPGAQGEADSEGCRVALNSPYAAVLKQRVWGGLPISLFGLGCFAYLTGHAVYVAMLGSRASRNAGLLYCLLALSPLVVSAVMFVISTVELGTICKTCAGIYIGSLLLAVSAVGVVSGSAGRRRPMSMASFGAAAGALIALGLSTLAPSLVYAAMSPDHSAYVVDCGKLEIAEEKHGALLKLDGPFAERHAVFFEDPLCPTCKSLHDRLQAAGVLQKLSIQLALFPLDSACNWMLDQPLHPGACQVSRAVLCAKDPRQMLDWTYEHQQVLALAGRRGDDALIDLLQKTFGAELTRCMKSNQTTQQLNRHLHFAVDNSVPVSTPQVFIDGQRLCDEDIDIGLMFALDKIAPGLLQ